MRIVRADCYTKLSPILSDDEATLRRMRDYLLHRYKSLGVQRVFSRVEVTINEFHEEAQENNDYHLSIIFSLVFSDGFCLDLPDHTASYLDEFNPSSEVFNRLNDRIVNAYLNDEIGPSSRYV